MAAGHGEETNMRASLGEVVALAYMRLHRHELDAEVVDCIASSILATHTLPAFLKQYLRTCSGVPAHLHFLGTYLND